MSTPTNVRVEFRVPCSKEDTAAIAGVIRNIQLHHMPVDFPQHLMRKIDKVVRVGYGGNVAIVLKDKRIYTSVRHDPRVWTLTQHSWTSDTADLIRRAGLLTKDQIELLDRITKFAKEREGDIRHAMDVIDGAKRLKLELPKQTRKALADILGPTEAFHRGLDD